MDNMDLSYIPCINCEDLISTSSISEHSKVCVSPKTSSSRNMVDIQDKLWHLKEIMETVFLSQSETNTGNNMLQLMINSIKYLNFSDRLKTYNHIPVEIKSLCLKQDISISNLLFIRSLTSLIQEIIESPKENGLKNLETNEDASPMDVCINTRFDNQSNSVPLEAERFLRIKFLTNKMRLGIKDPIQTVKFHKFRREA